MRNDLPQLWRTKTNVLVFRPGVLVGDAQTPWGQPMHNLVFLQLAQDFFETFVLLVIMAARTMAMCCKRSLVKSQQHPEVFPGGPPPQY